MREKIDYRFKILYALGMIMVVCGHCWGGGISLAGDWFPYGGMHLPLFMFCSGYFYKSSSEMDVKGYVYRKIKTLIIPLYCYTIAYGVIVQLSRLKGFTIGIDWNVYNIVIKPITSGHQFAYNMGGWFIVPLFMVQIYNVMLRKFFSYVKIAVPEAVFFCISIIMGLVGNYFASIGYLGEWRLPIIRMLYFVPFYGLGIFYKAVLEKYDKKIPGIYYFAFIFAAKLEIALIYKKMPAYTPSWCNDFTEGPAMPIIIGILGIAFWLRIATIAEPVMGKNKNVNLIADNTYSIMMNQFLGFMLVKTVYAVFNKFTLWFADFDWIKYKTDIWWYYMPFNIEHTLILYTIAGIVLPIMLQQVINRLKGAVVKVSPLKQCYKRKRE